MITNIELEEMRKKNKEDAIASAAKNSARRPDGWYDVYRITETPRYIVCEDLQSWEKPGGYDSTDLKFIGRWVNGNKT